VVAALQSGGPQRTATMHDDIQTIATATISALHRDLLAHAA
jgi:hypothetical protein